jgi:uncharacterized protein YraI
MVPTRLTICTATLVLMAAASAVAGPAYAPSTVNLRAAAGTTNEIVAKIPGGSLVDATNCTDWCEVDWQGKKGFVIATALDRSGRVPASRPVTRVAPPPGVAATGSVAAAGYVPVAPPAVVYGGPYFYGPRPYYWGYGPRWRYRYGYRRGYWRW